METTLLECPTILSVGERGNIAYRIRNAGSYPLAINGIGVNIDGNTVIDRDNSSTMTFDTAYDYPLTIEPNSGITIRGPFSSREEMYHNVELVLSHSMMTESGHTADSTTKTGSCQIKVIPLSAENQGDDSMRLFTDAISSPLAAILVLTPIGSFIAYKLQRKFVNKDFELQQRLQHRNLLLEKAHTLAESYYYPLANLASETRKALGIAEVSGYDANLRKAYYFMALFLSKYIEFQDKTGGNFLFISDRDDKSLTAGADKALGQVQAILVSLPFDREDIIQIANSVRSGKSEFKEPDYSDRTFRSFINWIMSKYCDLSRTNVMARLRELGRLLNDQAERLSQPNYFMLQFDEKEDRRQKDLEQSNNNEADYFWITHHGPKYALSSQTVIVFGNGFKDNRVWYRFQIGNFIVGESGRRFMYDFKVIDDSYVKIRIPHKIKPGTYDLYAKYRVGEKRYKTIGLVIHINIRSS